MAKGPAARRRGGRASGDWGKDWTWRLPMAEEKGSALQQAADTRPAQAVPLDGVNPPLSKLETPSSAQRGSAALLCGKPPAFRPVPQPPSSSTQAGRLSLPACAEEILQDARPSERQSLSASQAAEPQVIVHQIERNLDKCGITPGPTAALQARVFLVSLLPIHPKRGGMPCQREYRGEVSWWARPQRPLPCA